MQAGENIDFWSSQDSVGSSMHVLGKLFVETKQLARSVITFCWQKHDQCTSIFLLLCKELKAETKLWLLRYLIMGRLLWATPQIR